MRVVFFGTPEFAVPTLRRLATDDRFDVRLVVSQPDRTAGRGRRLVAPPIARLARELGLECYQPTTLRDAESRRPLLEASADLFVVAAYGLIFGARTLSIPRYGCVNVHASLLPRYRGASPISAAILAGDRETGVTLMLMETGLDTGPMLSNRRETIRSTDTTKSLTPRLAELGAQLAADTLPAYAEGAVVPSAQPSVGASLTRPMTKWDGWLDWNRPAAELERAVRAFWPWPRAWTTIGSERLQVHGAAVCSRPSDVEPGAVAPYRSELIVACGQGALRLTRVQAAGGRPMSDAAFLAGRRDPLPQLGVSGAPPQQPPLIVPVD